MGRSGSPLLFCLFFVAVVEVALQYERGRDLVDHFSAASTGHVSFDEDTLRCNRGEPFIPRYDRNLEPFAELLDELLDRDLDCRVLS